MEKISREEAHAANRSKYFTGEPCKHGHVAERFVVNTGCVECGANSQSKFAKRRINGQGFITVSLMIPPGDRAMIEELAASLRASHIPAPVAVPSSIAYVKKNADQ